MSKPSQFSSAPEGIYIRRAFVAALKKCKKTRAEVAAAMTSACGCEVTERMLSAYAADSREDYRLPAEFVAAFCWVTHDYEVLRVMVKRAGHRMVGPSEERYIAQAADKRIRLERKIVALQQKLEASNG